MSNKNKIEESTLQWNGIGNPNNADNWEPISCVTTEGELMKVARAMDAFQKSDRCLSECQYSEDIGMNGFSCKERCVYLNSVTETEGKNE